MRASPVLSSFISLIALCGAGNALAQDLSPAAANSTDESENEILLVEPLRDYVYSYGLRRQHPSTVGSAVSVITTDDLAAGQFSFAADALRLAPGVAVARNGSYGGFASARIRGGSSGQTLVVIDGVVVNDVSAPQGGFNFANLDVADIEQIEVLRGPQGLVWGADAIGGVIYITTRDWGDGVSAYAEGGSRGTARAGATAFGEIGGGFLRATISGARTDGISRAASGSEADGYRTIAASLTAGAPIGGADFRLFARASDSRSEIDGFPPPDFELADTLETENSRDYSIAGVLTHGSSDDFHGALSLAYGRVDRANEDQGVETFNAEGGRLTGAYRGAINLYGPVRINFGGEAERAAARVSGVDESISSGAIFSLIEINPFDEFTLSAGVRRDEFSAFKGATTSRFAGVWDVTARGRTQTRFRASWGQGFRTPSLFELYFDQFGVIPNPDLQPERANGFDVGVEIDRAWRLRATYFRQRVKDQIDFDFAGNGYFNIDRVKSQGVEIEAEARLGERVSTRLVYSFIDAKDANSGVRILRTPKHSGVVTISAEPTEKLTLSSTATFNGREADFPAANAAFVKLDLRTAYEISDTFEIYGRIENATDADYQDVSGFGEPGLSVFAGVRVTR